VLSETTRQRVESWLSGTVDPAEQEEVRRLLADGNEKELEDRFGVDMEFGTGGLRGVMEAGTNRMNRYTVARATQGLATYINRQKPQGGGAVIAYDSRHNSPEFARTAAGVLAANAIRVHLFRRLRPTPLLSFAVRYFKATAGIVITSSHNPKQYNGYKVYWEDGAQIVPPHDEGIIAEVKKIQSFDQIRTMDFDAAVADGLVALVDEEVDRAYLEAIAPLAIHREAIERIGGDFKVVYTPLHGAGGTMVPKALRSWGVRHVIEVPSQARPDGDFPTVPLANPEDPAALEEAIDLAARERADLATASDPDCDRLGVAAHGEADRFQIFTGNQMGALIGEYLCRELRAAGRMPDNPLMVTSIVTSDLLEHIGREHGVRVEEVLTGFKWICEKIHINEERRERGEPYYNFIYGTEESCGYLIGTQARDKDAIITACTVSEMAAWAKLRGQTLIDLFDELERKYGAFMEQPESIFHEGLEGAERIRRILEALRNDPPKAIGGIAVEKVGDVLLGAWKAMTGPSAGRVGGPIDLPKSDVLIFQLDDGGKVLARPSGTEPKIKFYFNMVERGGIPYSSGGALLEARRKATEKLHRVREDFLALLARLGE
jgi:phosphoglucomutase